MTTQNPQTLEELIEDTLPLYELPEGMVQVFGVDRKGIKYVAMAVDKEAFIKKVYEAGIDQGIMYQKRIETLESTVTKINSK